MAFGSRVKGTNRKYSDLDIALKGDALPEHIICNIKYAFEESDIPFTVDVVQYSLASDFLKEIIDRDGAEIEYKKN